MLSSNAISAEQFDDLSDEQINALLNQAAAIKGKRGRFASAPPSSAPRYVDFDAILESRGAK
jgi:hypothetical protein